MGTFSSETKKSIVTFAGIYLFLYALNYLHPMSFGDDYLYSFIWQGKPMNVPLSEKAVRIASWKDILLSQWSHYFTWGGRTVAHVLVQFFLWMGKGVFNYFNAFISIFLIAEINWCINRGKVSLNFKAKDICWIFFVLWAFTPGFSPVFFWLTAACNYLWTNVILITFLLPYIRKYYRFSQKTFNNYFSFFMLLFGVIAGWTNENSVCWVIVVLLIFAIKKRNDPGMETWLVTGLTGLITGYAFLVFAPGNAARLFAEQSGGSNWLNSEAFKTNFQMLLSIFFFQTFLWFFCLRSLVRLKELIIPSAAMYKDIKLIKVLCSLAFLMTAIMFFSPGFPARSGFSGTLLLTIATGMLLRIQDDYGIELILPEAKKFLLYVGIVFFVMTSSVTFYYFYKTHVQMQDIILTAKTAAAGESVLIVPPIEESGRKEDLLSGFHIPTFKLAENEDDWTNVAFSRYYGIKGIRMMD